MKKDRADASVAARLIETAEVLYGRCGLEGVSLRQISIAAGTGNNYAVQYHFGSTSGLIKAILEKRIPEVEVGRARLLSRAKARGHLSDVRELMEILYRPLVEHVNSRGERSYARFILALHSSPTGDEHTMSRLSMMPIAEHVLALLESAIPDIPSALLFERQRLISLMVLSSVFNRHEPYATDDSDPGLIDHVLDMATAALVTPMSKTVLAMVKRDARGRDLNDKAAPAVRTADAPPGKGKRQRPPS